VFVLLSRAECSRWYIVFARQLHGDVRAPMHAAVILPLLCTVYVLPLDIAHTCQSNTDTSSLLVTHSCLQALYEGLLCPGARTRHVLVGCTPRGTNCHICFRVAHRMYIFTCFYVGVTAVWDCILHMLLVAPDLYHCLFKNVPLIT
jgi:hypothetical protein